MGEAEEGLTVLNDALAAVNKSGGRKLEAELYRIKGTLTLQQVQVQGSKFQVTDPQPLTPDPQGEAEECFRKAIEIAQRALSLSVSGVCRVQSVAQTG
jgi:hypothetical protein